ncbi:unnamed protein product [Closterium sp. Naga37s-1]|nr:unnamed protein product [Closterium sp. Naga37s-1]
MTECAGNLPRPAPSLPEALASQPGDGGRQAPVLSAPLPVAPPVPLGVPTAASAPLGALQAADPAAPSAAAERAIVDGGVPAQSVGSATTDVLGQPAPPAAPAPPSAPFPALVPPLPVLAGFAPAPPVAAPPAPPEAVPLAPPVAAPLAPPETAPLAPPVAAPPAAGLSAPPVALPWVPPVAGVEFLTAAGGPVTVQYPSLLPVEPPPPSVGAAHPFQALLGPQRTVAGDSLVGGPRDDCLAAADRLAELLAPVLAAPARGGLAGVGPLGSAVRGLLHAGTGSGAIAAGTVLVRELHRTMSGLLAVYDADQM